MAGGFIVGGNRTTGGKPRTCRMALTTDTYALLVSNTGRFVNFVIYGKNAQQMKRQLCKYIQHTGEQKNDKTTNHYLQNTTQKPKD